MSNPDPFQTHDAAPQGRTARYIALKPAALADLLDVRASIGAAGDEGSTDRADVGFDPNLISSPADTDRPGDPAAEALANLAHLAATVLEDEDDEYDYDDEDDGFDDEDEFDDEDDEFDEDEDEDGEDDFEEDEDDDEDEEDEDAFDDEDDLDEDDWDDE